MSTTVSQHTVDASEWIAHAVRTIEKQQDASVSAWEIGKDLHKFGRNQSVGTGPATLMTLPGTETSETYGRIGAATNYITTVSSANAGDGETIVIQGHTVSSGELTEVSQELTLTGQTPVTLATPLARVQRLYNSDVTDLGGPVYVYENDTFASGVPATDTKIHLVLPSSTNQSVKSALSTATNEYLCITSFYATVLEKTQNTFASVLLETRAADGVWRQRADIASAAGTSSRRIFEPYFIVAPNTDVRLTATASALTTDVAGGIDGFYLRVIS